VQGKKLYPENVWGIFKQTSEYVPEELNISKKKGKYQLFEVVFTKIISLIQKNFSWKVTPIQGDGGVDFLGEQTLLNINELDINVRILVGGQCKRGKNKVNSITSLSASLMKMIHNYHPVSIIIGLATEISKKEKIQATNMYEDLSQASVTILEISQIDLLIRQYFEYLEPIFQYSLTSEKISILKSHFSKSSINKRDIEVEVSKSQKGETGTPFSVKIEIKSPLLSENDLRLQYINPQNDNKRSQLVLINPSLSIKNNGIEIIADKGFSKEFVFKFVSYLAGEQPLGKIHIKLGSRIIKDVSLGKIELADRYHPIFYWDPYRYERKRFEDLLNQMSAGRVFAIGIVGSGGSGKTRLSQEFGFYAEQKGVEFFSISHINNLDRPLKLIGDIFCTFVPGSENNLEKGLCIQKRLHQLNPSLAQKSKSLLNYLFSTPLDEKPGTVNKTILIQIFVTLAIGFLQENSLVLHLCDLHWCQNEVLMILSEFVNGLRDLSRHSPTKVLFLFEGRINEILQYHDFGQQTRHSTISFERFVFNNCDERIEIRPLNKKLSEGFLYNLFENSQSFEKRIPTKLIPHQKTLIEGILQYAEGNPFHMIEQIKLLLYKGIINRNERTGLLFLVKPLLSQYSAPNDVEILIRNRFNYIREDSGQLATLIQCVGLIKDRIPRVLFNLLKNQFAPLASEKDLEKTDIISFSKDSFSEVRFRHENYFQVIGNIPILNDQKSIAAKCYLEWMDREKTQEPEFFLDKARILALMEGSTKKDIEDNLLNALDMSEKQDHYHTAGRALEYFLKLQENPEEVFKSGIYEKMISRMTYQSKLAAFIMLTGDWEKASGLYIQLIKLNDSWHQKRLDYYDKNQIENLEYLRYEAVVQLANTYINQLKTHLSISILKSNLKYIAIKAKSENDSLKWNSLKIRALNRLGVAQWHDGNYSDSLETLSQSLFEFKRNLPNNLPNEISVLEHISLLDYGAVLLHRDALNGIEEIEKSIKIVEKIKVSPRYRILADITLVLAKMVQISQKKVKSHNTRLKALLKFEEELKTYYYQARKYGFIQEQSAAGLLIGILGALSLNDYFAKRWFMETISICFHHNRLETLWKAHLNLAQFLLEINEKESSALHTKYAYGIIKKDLSTRKGTQAEYRINYFTLPLAQILRIWRTLDSDNSIELLTKYPFLENMFCKTNQNKLKVDRHKFLKDHVSLIHKGQSDYFLYGA
jgi:hypothetical protein